MALLAFCCSFNEWNKFHPYKILRAYGSDMLNCYIIICPESMALQFRRNGSYCSAGFQSGENRNDCAKMSAIGTAHLLSIFDYRHHINTICPEPTALLDYG